MLCYKHTIINLNNYIIISAINQHHFFQTISCYLVQKKKVLEYFLLVLQQVMCSGFSLVGTQSEFALSASKAAQHS